MPQVNPSVTSNLSGVSTNNPLIIRGGRQVPNPYYTGPNPYKMDASGKLTQINSSVRPSTARTGASSVKSVGKGIPGGKTLGAITRIAGGATALSPDPNVSATDRMIGGFSAFAPLYGTAIAAAAGIGNWMKENLPESDFTSGRGSGAKALVGKKQRRADLKAQAETLKPYFPNAAYTEETPEVTPEVTPPSTPTAESGGTDTRTGTKYNSFQEQQDALMQSRVDSYKNRMGKDIDPRTEALIKGIPTNPFSSTQLHYTSDSLSGSFENIPEMSFGIDPSKMLDRASKIDYSKVTKDMPGFADGITLSDSFTSSYVSPVNYNAPQNSGDPMLNPDIDSMTAMQMKNRDAGLMYASGQFFAEGADGKAVLVNRGLAKAVRRGDEGAKDQLAAYLAGGGIKPEGGVIANPKMEQMVPPKTEETQITPTPGESPSYSSISAVDFKNTGAFSPILNSSLVGEEYELPEMTKKAGFFSGSQDNTDMFYRNPDIYKPFGKFYNEDMFKD